MQLLKQRIEGFSTSNLEETIDTYSKTKVYAQGEEARIDSFIYRSVTAENLGNDPITSLNILWTLSGISNRYAMLNLTAGTKSVRVGSSLVVEFPQNNIDTLVVGNYEASNIKVEILDAGSVAWTYESTFSINNGVYDWHSWTYQPYGYEIDRALMVKLGFVEAETTVRVTFMHNPNLSDRTACGYLIGGNSVDMGSTLYGVSFKFNSFTSKEFDSFGNLDIVKRGVQDLVDFNTVIDLGRKPLMTTKREIKEHYDSVVAFIVDESQESLYENMITLGIIQDASVVMNNNNIVDLAWSVQEVI